MAPSSVEIDFGSTVKLNCSAKSSGELTFSWFEANYGITEVNVFSSLREHNNVTNTIVVENVMTNLTYQCIISSEGHVLTSQEAYIGVLNVPPSTYVAIMQANYVAITSLTFFRCNSSRIE